MSRRRCLTHLAVSLLVAGAAWGAEPPPLLAPLSDGAALELPELDPEVPSPAAFLGYPLGSRFTHYHRIVDYLKALAEASPRAIFETYGETYEGRPLTLLTVSAPENLARLEEIRRAHRAPAALGPEERQRLADETPVVVWLGYGIHGNESSSAEAAMAAAYLLAAGPEGLLREVVVVIDPLENPDGRERFVSGFEQRRGRRPDLEPLSAEHFESWPGGRYNHYLFDLNRDWTWATQRETRDRLAAYHRWEPAVFVDLHEMSSHSTYFFPPPAQPVHPYIDRHVVSWLDTFGQGNAAAFDRLGWVYFNAEGYDLFYPGYGDSYPSLRGAVGMTYEMAGGGRAGQAIRLPDGRQLTLADRVARHLTASLATVETAAANRRSLMADRLAARLAAEEAPAGAYLWEASAPEGEALAVLLRRHGIEVGSLRQEAELTVEPLDGDSGSRRRFAAGSYLVSTRQPLGGLARALLDLDAPMDPAFVENQRLRVERDLSPEFYDITAWSLPLAFRTPAWRLSGEPPAAVPWEPSAGGVTGEGELGYLVPPAGLGHYRAAARLLSRDVRFRLALSPLETGGESFPAGTLFVPRVGNAEGLEQEIAALAKEEGLKVRRVASSYVSSGISLGSERMLPVRRPRIGIAAGAGVSPTAFGSLWHLLDRVVEVPHHRLDLDHLDSIQLAKLDVLVLPDGWGYGEQMGEEAAQEIDRFVRAGGTLVAIEGAVDWLVARKLVDVEPWKPPGDEKSKPEEPGRGTNPLAGRPLLTPGAVVATTMRPEHPLTVGYEAPPPVLVRGTTVLTPTGSPQKDVLTVVEGSPVVAGFAWPEAEERLAGSLLVATEPRGDGRIVVFAQDPAFRGFWRATMPLFLNAVIYGPSLGEAGGL